VLEQLSVAQKLLEKIQSTDIVRTNVFRWNVCYKFYYDVRHIVTTSKVAAPFLLQILLKRKSLSIRMALAKLLTIFLQPILKNIVLRAYPKSHVQGTPAQLSLEVYQQFNEYQHIPLEH
jgi:hypothetical protein